MFGDARLGLASPQIRRLSQEITHPAILGEMEKRRLKGDSYCRRYAMEVRVPVRAAIGERDRLFQASKEDLWNFTGAFTNPRKVETVFIPGTPHGLELSHWDLEIRDALASRLSVRRVRASRAQKL